MSRIGPGSVSPPRQVTVYSVRAVQYLYNTYVECISERMGGAQELRDSWLHDQALSIHDKVSLEISLFDCCLLQEILRKKAFLNPY